MVLENIHPRIVNTDKSTIVKHHTEKDQKFRLGLHNV